jgi:hypothetical protein
MGYLLVFFCLIVIACAVITAASGNGKPDPAKLGGDLADALSRGDRDRCRKIIQKLADWKVRSRLREAVEGTVDLRRDAGTARLAGVSPHYLGPLDGVVGRNEQIIVAVTRKIASLTTQSSGSYRKLPAQARNLIEDDARRLAAMTCATLAVRESLAVATASVDSGDAASCYDALHGFGRALRDLSGA